MEAAAASYWCHRCNRSVLQIWSNGRIACPDCQAGFVEEVEDVGTSQSISRNNHDVGPLPQQGQIIRRINDDRVNPVIVLRSGGRERGFELYYGDGAGGGLRRLPPSMSQFLLGSGIERLLERSSSMEITSGLVRYENDNNYYNNSSAPACKAAIEAMPTVVITARHVDLESQCAVCKEKFVLESEAKEMPCKHLYHSECIIPWLSIRNSCPVCRHQLPAGDDGEREAVTVSREGGDEEEAVGLTIWRLPGGGYAVGRFVGRREREMPVLYPEMEGGLINFGNDSNNNVGLVRRRWLSRGGGVRRVLRQLLACFGASASDRDSRIRRMITNGGSTSNSNIFLGWRRIWRCGQ